MQNRSKPPIRKLARKSGSEASLFVMSWGLGMMSGVVASAIAVMCALALGYLSLGVQGVSAHESLSSPNDTIVEALVSPTQLAEALTDGTPTITGYPLSSATPTPPATMIAPDYVATATKACSLFKSNFPGTPCPRFNTPTP